MTQYEMIERLGQAQQKVMSLTVAKRRLEARLEKVEERAEVLEELVMEIFLDLRDGFDKAEINKKIGKVIRGLDADG